MPCSIDWWSKPEEGRRGRKSEGRNPKTEARGRGRFGLRPSTFGFNPLSPPGSANLSSTPRFSGVTFDTDDIETVSTVSIRLPTVPGSLHQEMGYLLDGDRET